jgi:hypothetical protein
MERKRVAEAAKGVGRPKVGGPFSLLDQNGKVFTDGEMKGRYSLVRIPMVRVHMREEKVEKKKDRGENCANASLGIGLLRLHPLPRHLPRRAR